MKDVDSRVHLVVGGADYSGWKSVSITAGIDRQARDFKLSVTHRWPGSDEVRRVAPGDECKVYIGTDLVLTGYVDSTPIIYDKDAVTVAVKGRSKTGDLVDCSADQEPGQWKDRTIKGIVEALVKPFKIDVDDKAKIEDLIPDHQLQQGETVFESIDRLLRLRSLLSTDDAEGRLVLTRAGSETASTDLVVGRNILTGKAALDAAQLYSKYTVKGQRPGGGDWSRVEETHIDLTVKRLRPLVIVMDGQPDHNAARERVNWEQAFRYGRSRQAVYTVQGWRQADGKLWVPNQLVRVKDPIIGFDDDFLITEVTYGLSDLGTIATLTVAPREAYDLRLSKPKGKNRAEETLGTPKVEVN
ncbi:phage baseplate assembly protein [Azospirillum soli]|uniref:phage baseplate assembly protein n=1 Tax=Azospirillum soli TaxID=1304799 RepID=UPI001AE1DB47|nr:contractile injection system protein, VgrG/Pvc8 family [Azospirillum soli]MBP2314896.1 prophage tail gpP-like protein [Azospirillum soli]